MEAALVGGFGLLVGWIGGYAGMGGGPMLTWLLVTFAGWSQHAAQGTVVAIMLGPMTLSGVWVMRDRARPQWKLAAVGVVTYACFSYLGALLAYQCSDLALRRLFALLLLGLGMRSWWSGRERAGGTEPEPSPRLRLTLPSMTVLGSLVGVAGGLFGIGAGVLLVPLLTWLYGAHKDDARALSLLILLPPVSIGAALGYHAHGDVRWPMAAVGFVAYFCSNYWGARLGRSDPAHRFQRVMAVMLLFMGATLLGP